MSNREEIRKRLQAIFQEVFDDDELEIDDATSADDVDDWDSIMHITLMVAVEKEFGMQFNAEEIGKLSGVGGLIDLIEQRAG
ncbi:MAG: acyl carrier protein [Desulfovibrionaceae bacterium]|jgi:acyl carrier protein|nr:acyl carrier protein [Desulfovibrionaceae bacterium]